MAECGFGIVIVYWGSMQPVMMAPPRLLLLLACWQLTAYFTQALMIRRVIVPHTAKPGYIVSSLMYWGQHYTVDSGVAGEFSKYFTVLSNGDLVTSVDVSCLIGNKISLVINNDLASESWQESIHIEIQDSHNLLLFPQQIYEGHLLENQSPLSPIPGLEDIYAHIGGAGHKSIQYMMVSGPTDLFTFNKKLVDGQEHLEIVTKDSLDREEKEKYTLMIKAWTECGDDEPAYAKAVVHVLDENDNIPKFEKSLYFTSIRDNTAPLTTILKVKAVDPDDGKIKYVMEPHRLFEIDPQEGSIVLKSRKDLELQNYKLQVYAEDEGGQKSDPATIDIKVNHVNGALRFESSVSHVHHSRYKRDTTVHPEKEFEVPESRKGELIRLNAGSVRYRYYFKDPAPEKLDLNSNSGAISLKRGKQLDYELEEEISFVVEIVSVRNPSGKLSLQFCKFNHV